MESFRIIEFPDIVAARSLFRAEHRTPDPTCHGSLIVCVDAEGDRDIDFASVDRQGCAQNCLQSFQMMGQILAHRKIAEPEQCVLTVEHFAVIAAQHHATADLVNHGALDELIEACRDFRIVAHFEGYQRLWARLACIAEGCKIGQAGHNICLTAPKHASQGRCAIGKDCE